MTEPLSPDHVFDFLAGLTLELEDPVMEELIKKAAEQARLLAITRPQVVKVVCKEAKKIGIDHERITSAKEEPEYGMVIKKPKYRIFFIDVLMVKPSKDGMIQSRSGFSGVIPSNDLNDQDPRECQDAQPESIRKTLAFSEAVLSE
nr:hypothetical protein [Tanacetum cinerariifolium]